LRTETFDNGQNYTAEHYQQEKVHKEEEQRTLQSSAFDCHEVAEKYGIIEQSAPFGNIEECFDMTDDNQHEPAESYTGVHISQYLVASPELNVKQAISKPVANILSHYHGIDKGFIELDAIFALKLNHNLNNSDNTPEENEYHSHHKWENKMVETRYESFPHHSVRYCKSCKLKESDAWC
jgi:hypothetical protein